MELVNTVTNGSKKFGHTIQAGHINKGFFTRKFIVDFSILTRVFLQENLWQFFPGGQKTVAVITR